MTTGAKMRVYEIAREMGVPNKELISHIRGMGLQVNNHMSSLAMDDVTRVKESLHRKRKETTETKRLSSTVLRRRSKGDKPTRRAVEETPEREAEPDGYARVSEAAESRPRPAAPVQRRPVARTPAQTAPVAPPAVEARKPEPAARPPEPAQPAATETAPPVQPAEPAASTAPSARPPADAAPLARTSAPGEAAPAAAREASEVTPSAATPTAAEREPAPATPATPVEAAPSEPAVAAGDERRAAAETRAPDTGDGVARREAAEAEDRSRTPVIIQLPSVVRLPGEPEPAPAAPPATAATARPSERAATAQPKAKPKRGPTVQDYTQNARSRFEEELERARKRVREREDDERKKREAEEAKTTKERDGSRPAVGTVINLPVPRIEIKERGPRQAARGTRFATPRARTGRNKRDFGRKRQQKGRTPGKSTQITTPAEHKRVIRMEDTIAIPELAKAMAVKASEVLKKLWGMGMVGVNINASIDHETAGILASEFGYEVQNVAFKEADVFVSQPDEMTDLAPRAPVVTVMGHVDHGKTSLLDAIRKSRVAAGEAGGITQHIAAYKVEADGDYGEIVFLDTPGHEAFTEMRARGAQATDIVVLVVAANDGVMPQTAEALNHAKDAKVHIIVAVNKCDLPDAQPERVRQQLADHGLIPEEWGGDTLYVNVSAHTGEGLDKLLESISLTAELAELKANPSKPAVGVVIEAKLDRHRGSMATVLVQEGTLRAGDIVVAGECYGKVRAMLDHRGEQVKEAGPSTPVELLGLDGVPLAGETLNVADDEKVAKQVVEHRRQAQRKRDLAQRSVSLENLMERINEGEQLELKIVLKADVQGSAEALKAALLKQSTDKVKVNVIQAGVGGITETDVNLAKASGAIIIGFHVRPAGKAGKHAEREGVEINLYDVIYEAIDEVRNAMAGLLEPVKREVAMGTLEVRDTFQIPRRGTVAGCMVTSGKVQRRSLLRVVRDAVQIYEGKVGSLRRFKEDTSEVAEGYECGLMIEGFNDIKVGDVVEAYEIVEEAAQL